MNKQNLHVSSKLSSLKHMKKRKIYPMLITVACVFGIRTYSADVKVCSTHTPGSIVEDVPNWVRSVERIHLSMSCAELAHLGMHCT